MKKMKNVFAVLVIALLFTGCSKTQLPENKNSQEVQQDLQGKESEEVKDEKEPSATDREENEKYPISVQPEETAEKIKQVVIIDEETLVHLKQVAEEYYESINLKMISFIQADSTSSFLMEYEGYSSEEVVLFEVFIENDENKRYITLGSKDGWNNCDILNEGY